MSEDVLFADNLKKQARIRHAFFTKAWTDLSRMAAYLGVADDRFLRCRQIHSSRVIRVDKVWAVADAPEADAMVTNMPEIALGILTADCVPILLADSQVSVIGAAHAGWRGALGGVVERTVEAMEKLGARRESMVAALGPCIWQDSYEVGDEFLAPFLAEDEAHIKYFKQYINNNKYHFDIKGYVVDKLHGAKVGSIASSPADTYADPTRFFSYRYLAQNGENDERRLISAIALK